MACRVVQAANPRSSFCNASAIPPRAHSPPHTRWGQQGQNMKRRLHPCRKASPDTSEEGRGSAPNTTTGTWYETLDAERSTTIPSAETMKRQAYRLPNRNPRCLRFRLPCMYRYCRTTRSTNHTPAPPSREKLGKVDFVRENLLTVGKTCANLGPCGNRNANRMASPRSA